MECISQESISNMSSQLEDSCEIVENNETIEEDSIKIHIDYRETKLICELTQIVPSVTVTRNLDLGDILIVSTGKYPFTLLFERKAGGDLEASIKDHRYSEQKKRILSIYPPHKCTYIIEGISGVGENSNYMLNSAMVHTMYRDNMHIVNTANASATANFIKTVYDRCIAHPEYFCERNSESSSSSGNSYIENTKIKSRKIENIDVNTCYLLQLCQIPGISHGIAKEIAKIYPNMSSLIDALRNCKTPAEKIKLLGCINMIAKKKATKIAEYICV